MFHHEKHEGNIYWTYCSNTAPVNSISHKAITDTTRLLLILLDLRGIIADSSVLSK